MAKLGSREIILYPLVSEDAVTLIEAENKVTFIVDRRASKTDVRRAVEELYEVTVDRINTLTTPDGRKKAFVKLSTDFKAADLAVKLGIL